MLELERFAIAVSDLAGHSNTVNDSETTTSLKYSHFLKTKIE